MRKVLFLDTVHPLIPSQLTKAGYRCDFNTGSGPGEIGEIIGEYFGVIIRSRITLNRVLLDKAVNLKFIGRVGAGMENIDVEYAQHRRIRCLNSPEGNRDAVGEHTLGLLLCLMNNMIRADRQVRNGQWIREGNRGIEIRGKTIGIVGYGHMGSAFAQRLKGFNANVISWDKYKQHYSDGNTREAMMDELFENSDILSLHVPLTEETRYLVDGKFIESFRKPFFLVNTSRGAVIRTADLVHHLESGKVLGAALDVLEYENLSFENLAWAATPEMKFLMHADNVVMTPHIAGWTAESNVKLAQVLVDKIITNFAGTKTIENEV